MTVRLDDGVGGVALGLAEQAHECNVYTLVAEHLSDVRHNARLVLLNDNDRAVFTGKVNLNAVNTRDAAFAAAERLTANGHHLTGSVLHADVHRVRMDIGLGFTGRERVGQAALGRNRKRIADAGVIGRKAHDAAEAGRGRCRGRGRYGQRSSTGQR